jgi:polyisoprenoid-binding protein YceI
MSETGTRSRIAASAGSSSAANVPGYTIDPVHSSIAFSVRHLMITDVHGEFTKFKADVHFDPEDLSECSVYALIQADSIHTGNEKRDQHLRSADFFDVENHPRLIFRSRRFHRSDDGRLLIDGDLTIRGVTLPVTFFVKGPTPSVKDPWGNDRIGLVATTRINRHDFGINWNQKLEGGGVMVGREVKITLDLSLVSQ